MGHRVQPVRVPMLALVFTVWAWLWRGFLKRPTDVAYVGVGVSGEL